MQQGQQQQQQGQGPAQGYSPNSSRGVLQQVQTNGTDGPNGNANVEWVADGNGGSEVFGSEKDGHRVFVENHNTGHTGHVQHQSQGHGVGNSVRKRLSILRLGKKSSKNGPGGLGGLDEE